MVEKEFSSYIIDFMTQLREHGPVLDITAFEFGYTLLHVLIESPGVVVYQQLS
jgi:hypothetical protein